MRLATLSIAIFVFAVIGCGRKPRTVKVEIKPISVDEFFDTPEQVASCNETAMAMLKLKQFKLAESNLTEAIAIAKKLKLGDNVATADTLNIYGLLETARNKFDEAERYYVQSEEMYRRIHKGDHLQIVTVLNNRVLLAQLDADAPKAERLDKAATEMTERLKAKEKPDNQNRP